MKWLKHRTYKPYFGGSSPWDTKILCVFFFCFFFFFFFWFVYLLFFLLLLLLDVFFLCFFFFIFQYQSFSTLLERLYSYKIIFFYRKSLFSLNKSFYVMIFLSIKLKTRYINCLPVLGSVKFFCLCIDPFIVIFMARRHNCCFCIFFRIYTIFIRRLI